jgi:hypothetical protein
MNYIIESILVGIYTCFIYLFFSHFIKNFYILLLVCGFFKHFLGSAFGIWTWYCNNGEACLKVLDEDLAKQNKYEANTLYLIPESIYEGFAFLITGTLLNISIPKGIYLFLIMGILLHIISEILSIHKYFCKKTCEIKTN